MYCGKCGAKLNDDSKFCFKCGNPVTSNVIEDNSIEPKDKIYQKQLLKCDLCGGTITIMGGNQEAICDFCGAKYAIERLKEKLTQITGTVSIDGPVDVRGAISIDESGKISEYIKLGEVALFDGQYDESYSFFNKAYVLDTKNPQIVLDLALSLLAKDISNNNNSSISGLWKSKFDEMYSLVKLYADDKYSKIILPLVDIFNNYDSKIYKKYMKQSMLYNPDIETWTNLILNKADNKLILQLIKKGFFTASWLVDNHSKYQITCIPKSSLYNKLIISITKTKEGINLPNKTYINFLKNAGITHTDIIALYIQEYGILKNGSSLSSSEVDVMINNIEYILSLYNDDIPCYNVYYNPGITHFDFQLKNKLKSKLKIIITTKPR